MNTFVTLPGCLPFEIHPEGAVSGVLLIHGYTGTPREMRYLAERIAESGRAVVVPRLPGAGTDMEDLSGTTRHQWKRRVLDSWQDLKSRYAEISVVGYSMGGILALDLASHVPVKSIVLLAPAILISHPYIKLTPILAPFAALLPKIRTDWEPEENDSEETRELGQRYWSKRDVRSLAQLRYLQISTRRRLGRIEAPVFTIVSSKDPSVPTRVLGILERCLTRGLQRSLVVEKCRHDVPNGADKETVAEAILAWMSGK